MGRLQDLVSDSFISSSSDTELLLLRAEAYRVFSRQQTSPEQASAHLDEAFKSLQTAASRGGDRTKQDAGSAALVADCCKQLAGLCSDLMQARH